MTNSFRSLLKNKSFTDLVKSSVVYGLSSSLDKVLPLLLLPILTSYLSPESYGKVAMFYLLLYFLFGLMGGAIISSIGREYHERDNINYPNFVTNCLYLIIASILLMAILIWILDDVIAYLLNISVHYVWYTYITGIFLVFIRSRLVIWQASIQPVRYAVFQFSRTSLDALFSIFLVVYLMMENDGRVYGNMAATILLGIVSLYSIISNKLWEPSLNTKYMKRILAFSIPVMPHLLASSLIFATDRLLVLHLLDIGDVGLYTAGVQLGIIISFFAYSFNQAWSAWSLKELSRNDEYTNRFIVKLTYMYIAGIFLCATLFSLSAPFIVHIFLDDQYVDSLEVVTWIAFSGAFEGVYYMFSSYITYTRKTFYQSYITLLRVVLNLVVSYVLILKFGIEGAAIGTMLSAVFASFSTFLLARKIHPMPWFAKT